MTYKVAIITSATRTRALVTDGPDELLRAVLPSSSQLQYERATIMFLEASVNRRSRLFIYALHRWLDRRRLTLAEFTREHFRQFFARPGRVRVAMKIRFQR